MVHIADGEVEIVDFKHLVLSLTIPGQEGAIGLPDLRFQMVVWALKIEVAFRILTFLSLVIHRVKLILLPPVTLRAGSLLEAAFFVLADEGASLPDVAEDLGVIEKKMGLAAKILPVMSVIALGFVMVSNERTPLRLKIKHVEVHILL